jgi:hypothetical protein
MTETESPRMTPEIEATLVTGDVILDSYANPAVVIHARNGEGICLLMLTGSDMGRITYMPFWLQRVTDPVRQEHARAKARKIWREKHLGRLYV